MNDPAKDTRRWHPRCHLAPNTEHTEYTLLRVTQAEVHVSPRARKTDI